MIHAAAGEFARAAQGEVRFRVQQLLSAVVDDGVIEVGICGDRKGLLGMGGVQGAWSATAWRRAAARRLAVCLLVAVVGVGVGRGSEEAQALAPTPAYLAPVYEDALWGLVSGSTWPETFPASWVTPAANEVSVAAKALPAVKTLGVIAAGAVVVTQPVPATVGRPTTVTLIENPDPKPILLPAANPDETYADYLARLRALGWLGIATVVDLDADNGDPSYGPAGVPCRYPIPTVSISPDEPITFYRNPTTFNGVSGGNAADWDCTPGGGPSLPDCEYDAAYVTDYTWGIGRTYAQQNYDDACAGAWNHFLAIGGFSLGGQPERDTGILKDPLVRSFLTSDGSGLDDWRKWEWGPFTVTINAQQLDFVVHGYKNTQTGEVRRGKDKVKFRTEIAP